MLTLRDICRIRNKLIKLFNYKAEKNLLKKRGLLLHKSKTINNIKKHEILDHFRKTLWHINLICIHLHRFKKSLLFKSL